MSFSSARHLKLLRYTLRANAVFSALSALSFLSFAQPLATLVAIGREGFVGLGINLAVFSAILFLVSTRWALRRRWVLALVLMIALMDVAWVLGSAFLAYLPSYATEGGRLLILATAGVVGLFAVLQLYALMWILWSRYRGRRASRQQETSRQKSLSLRALLELFGIVLLMGGCSAADIRPAELKEKGYTETTAEKGRAMLRRVAKRHGLRAWQAYETMQATAVDRWADAAPSWWPLQEQRVRLEYVLGTFTSRAVLLDGERAGEVWGVHAWQPYHRAGAEQAVELCDTQEKMTARMFYLPALHYFNELPFRLLKAEYVAYAGDRVYQGTDYHLVFATWGSVGPNDQHDQYLLWIDRETLLVEMCLYTVRDAGAIFTGTIHFDDYRDSQGVMFPYTQTVILPPPEHTLYPLDQYYFHRLEFESVRFGAVNEQDLLVVAQKPAQDTK